jgi:branched-chain amino acid transport system ATP-binding protein
MNGAMSGAIGGAALETRGLIKRYGGLVATNDVSLALAQGELHAVIGPNGAGKTTLIALLGGDIPPDEGRIALGGADVTARAAPARAVLGLARSFQITSIFGDFSVLDNVAMAVQAHDGHSFRFWRAARRDGVLREPARAILDRIGLRERADTPAALLAHGEKRALEIAMALATKPRVLLLDEPMAGMGPEESRQIVALLRSLKGSLSILLVEHDMDAVFALADRISVLVYGRIIATGTPDAIRADAAVRAAYLGDGDA